MRPLLILLMMLSVGAAGARADLIISLDNPSQSGTAGDKLIFTGILSNTGGGTLFLNSVSFNLAGSSFLVDFLDPFFSNVPFSLGAGESSSDIELFDVTLKDPFTDPAGTYVGAYTLLGGSDGNAQTVLRTVNFTVAVPEPSSLIEFGSFLTGLLILLTAGVKRGPVARAAKKQLSSRGGRCVIDFRK